MSSHRTKSKSGKANQKSYQPQIKRLHLEGLEPVDIPAGAMIFVVGPNNGGKSTFLREINARVGHVSDTKWVRKLEWDLGTEDQWTAFTETIFDTDSTARDMMKDQASGHQVHKSHVRGFFVNQKISYGGFLVRSLNAEGRINLANQTDSPDVTEKRRVHPYHAFFFDVELEASFSGRLKSAFGKDFRINRSGRQVHGHLGSAPRGQRLSEAYEHAILTDMERIDRFGDGVRSYAGILLNSVADARPVTIIDEPEAFLHPPQARRLGREMALAAKEQSRQVFVATHSADFIQGALQAKNKNTLFLYLDHTNERRKLFSVSRDVVEDFAKKPFLQYTNALDALFYEQAVVCEGEADIMFFKWALEGSQCGRQLQESFWLSSYGKAAIPGIMEDMAKLGIRTRAIFDLDVLLNPEILERVCRVIGVEFGKHESMLRTLPKSIKVPPTAEALANIEKVISELELEEADEPSRLAAIRKIKKSAEGLGKSWVLKSTGLSALGRGEMRAKAEEFVQEMRSGGVVILEEGEIENYLPTIGLHGQAWVRAALERDELGAPARDSIDRQLTAGLLG